VEGFLHGARGAGTDGVAGDGIVSPLIKPSWERFKFGGRPGSQQRAYFVTLKELPNNRFGTRSEIYWDDAYMNAITHERRRVWPDIQARLN
jgi:membrane protease subunit (stomatin/prohibitin family)